jgi:hypothetical protein
MSVTSRLFCRAAVAASIMLSMASAGHAAGVLAVGKCGAYGFSYDYKRAAEAQTAALQRCTGGDCKPIAFSRGCAALAVDGANKCGPHGFATATKLGQAQNTALEQCYRFGGKDCVIRAFVCDAKG